MNFRVLLAGGVASLALASHGVYAAEAPATGTAAAAEDPQTTSVGTGANDSGEIVVTARRRQETAQDVPLAISVVGGEHIDNTGAFNVGRLQQLTPTLQFYSSNPRNTAVNIRGLGAPFGLTNDGIEQGVGIYIDDVYNARVASATFDFLDVKQIEVLRGPQGTLYGKNTTAGAINITTNQPTFDFEGKAEVSVGNLNFVQAKAAVSGPITDTLAARLAVSSTNRRGTIYNVTSKQWIQGQDNLGLRGQLLFQPSETFSVTLAGDYSEQDAACCGSVYVRTGTTQRALDRQFAALAAAQGYTVPSTNPYDRLTDLDATLQAGNKIGGVSLKAKWDIGPGTLTSVTAWRFWDWKPQNDRDFTGLPIVTKSQNPSQQDQYTQELRYNYSGDRFDFVLGAFGFYQRIDTQGTEQHGSASTKWNLAPSNALYNSNVLDGLTALNTQYLKNTSVAVYGQASWKVTPELTLQPGVRVNYDKKDGFYQRRVFTAAGNEILIDGTTSPTKTAQLGIFTPQTISPKFSDWNFSYDFTASYKVAPGILFYATYAKTFKSGGINQNGVPTDAANNPILAAATVKPESVQHYEAGLKTEFWDRRAIFNLSAYRTDIEDYQANVNNGQFGVLRGYLANAGAVRSQGIEADFSIRPSERFNAYVNGAYTDATYRKFVDAPCPPELSGVANCDISGQRLPGVSKWSFSFGLEANAPVTFLKQNGEVYFGYDGSYRSNFSSNPTPSIYTWVDGYSLSNFRAGFRTDDGFDVYGWVRNAFDHDYIDQLFVGPGNTGLIAGLPGDPRTWGLTLRKNF
ncbi:TonB-dependent receptor [Novosphingobium taihuense]|uniref:Iron complex outermembrane receptor protein n=1 Tax=Novosphingobium taihuense TaxID=260085 RepID=A0A7W7EU10_9SPHN|nr:TonB-dependent receptor [Novosphingobium taihuense]MBB4613594.1 iron complex outermembrane receptor protein [Novosphingobium taihuense]TWH81162.1 iron complex outermembrane receptor protein [Novosphingobium taihuense]